MQYIICGHHPKLLSCIQIMYGLHICCCLYLTYNYKCMLSYLINIKDNVITVTMNNPFGVGLRRIGIKPCTIIDDVRSL